MVVRQFPARAEDLALQALADPTRRDILARTLRRERSISALAEKYPMSFTAVQKHVGVLERAGLVTKHRRGREQLVHGEIDAVRAARRALDALEDVWRSRLDRFGDVLADLTAPSIRTGAITEEDPT